MLSGKFWTNPCSALSRPLGVENMTPASRHKQWYTGEHFWLEMLDSTTARLTLDNSWLIVVVDLAPYDGKLQEAVVMKHLRLTKNQTNKAPRFMGVSSLWANTSGGAAEDNMDAAKIEMQLQKESSRIGGGRCAR